MRRTAILIAISSILLAAVMIREQLEIYWNQGGWIMDGWCATSTPPFSIAELVFIPILLAIGFGAIIYSQRSAQTDRELSEGLGLTDQLHK
jgi:hypothetical protein